jgi:predicted dehydrogenase
MERPSNRLVAFDRLTKRCELVHTKSANEERIAVALAATKTPAAKLVRPIIIIGAGGITRDAHLPAYQKAGFPVCALVDVDRQKAENLAAGFSVPFATNSLEEALKASPPQCVFDLAVPASALLSILRAIPDGAAVLMQKPMGESLLEAQAILAVCREKGLTAAVNFQLRYAPVMLLAKELSRADLLGTVHDMEIQVNVHMPWELWSFLASAPRLEILYHSIHYIDLVRAWFGEPTGVYAKTVRNPRTPGLACTKSVVLFDYGDWKRVYLATNHSHDFGPEMQRSFVQWEGTEGAIHVTMGVNLDYPRGKTDSLKFTAGREWRTLPVSGDWFPDAFIGSMGALQAFLEGTLRELPNGVDRAIQTMRVVEAAYVSSEGGGVPISVTESST